MTTICGGGTSSPKAGLAEFVAVSSGAIALALQRYGAARLQFLIPLLGLPPLELPTFCATDPPAMPTFTSDEVFSLLRVGLDGDYFSGLSKARDMVLRMLWYDLCECDVGSPSAIGAPSLPTDTPDPILPVGPNVAPCLSSSFVSTNCDTGNLYKGSSALATGQNPTGVRLTMIGTDCGAGASAGVFNWVWTFRSATATSLGTKTYSLTGTQTTVAFEACPAGTLYLDLNHNQTGGVRGQQVVGSTVEFFCNNSIPGPTTPCCPPDPATQNSLDLILQMITLIQRQLAPFGYVASTSHTGLSGAGSIDIGGLLGVKMSATTIPVSYGREGTSPTEFFELGFVTFGTADGFPSAYRLERSEQLLLPPRCSAYTQIDYDLAPGVVIDLVELLREP